MVRQALLYMSMFSISRNGIPGRPTCHRCTRGRPAATLGMIPGRILLAISHRTCPAG